MILRLVLAGILAVTMAAAQGKKGGGGGGSKGGDSGFPMMRTVTPLERIAEVLKLDKDQKKDIKNMLDEAQKEATPVHEQVLKSRDAIAEAIAAGKSQDEIAKLVQAEAAVEGQLTTIEMKAFANLYQSLNPEQRNQNTRIVFMMTKGFFNKKNWNSTE